MEEIAAVPRFYPLYPGGSHDAPEPNNPWSPAQEHSPPTTIEEIAMEDPILRFGSQPSLADVLPETLEEAEQLAASIEQAVQRETDRGIADLIVEVNAEGILLRGRCTTYYTKQLAQHAAMSVRGGDRLVNGIEVF
ncbi:MAG: BON domain-containing protein [Planctomycetaceae bacterium]|nr:BON domain-containing protein [Planctomycetaceae bacterium]